MLLQGTGKTEENHEILQSGYTKYLNLKPSPRPIEYATIDGNNLKI